QVLRPKPTVDAINPLLRLKVNPPPETLAQPVYPQTEQLGPTVQKAALLDSPLPPPRPAGLGSLLSKAVVPSTTAQAQQQQQASVPATTQSLFGTTQLNPNQRNAPVYTTLNVGSLFGGGGGAPAPAQTQAG